MSSEAPLQITVEIRLQSGAAAGQRRFRLSRTIQLPPALCFSHPLPVEGEGPGRVRFKMPDGEPIEATATLHSDPEFPQRGSIARLLDVTPQQLQTILAYIEKRMEQ